LKGVKAQLIAEQTVPTSYSLNTERKDKELLPTFNTQSVHLSGKFLTAYEWKAFAGHFNWSNMPSTVAVQSQRLGNSTNDSIGPGMAFKSRFDGYFAGGELCTCNQQGTLGFVLEYQRVLNTVAVRGFGNAQTFGLGPHFVFGERVLDVRYRRFFSERDSTVSYYMTSFLGNTNRVGDEVEAKFDFRDYGFALVGKWANALTIRDSKFQETITSFELGVETHYAPF
jgi:hypothetical protein